MLIDCHTHIGRNSHIRATADELLRSVDKVGIDKSLVFAGEINDAPTEWVLEQIAPHKDRLLGVASIPGTTMYHQDNLDKMKKIIDWYGQGDIVAVKFYTGYDHYYPANRWDVLEKLNQVGCPAIFHSGDCLNSVKCAKLKYAHPLHIDEVAVDYPNINFIIAHMGFPWHRDAAEVCYKNANVYADISGFVYGHFSENDKYKFEKVLDEFTDIAGNGKLLFGTDSPISDQKSYIEAMCEAGWVLDIMTKTALKAFKLKNDE